MLDVSCAGHIDSGEDIVKSALRELQEELEVMVTYVTTHKNWRETKYLLLQAQSKARQTSMDHLFATNIRMYLYSGGTMTVLKSTVLCFQR